MAATSFPLNSYFPDVGVSRQPSMFMRVDLPDPEGPMIARYSLRRISSVTPRRAWIVSSPIWYSFVTPSMAITKGPTGLTGRVSTGAGGLMSRRFYLASATSSFGFSIRIFAPSLRMRLIAA